MGEHVDHVPNAPVAKRQRTGDGPPTDGSGDGGASAGERTNGTQKTNQNQKGQGGGGRKKKGNMRDPRISQMQQAVKKNNLQVALNIFRETVADGASVHTTVVNSLMYVACGGEQWERYARGLPPLTGAEVVATASAAAAAGGEDEDAGAEAEAPAAEAPQDTRKAKQQSGKQQRPQVPALEGPPPPREELVAAMDELWAYMEKSGLPPDQGTYLGLARREALKGDPQGALQWARECFRKGKPVQLRLFHPAQVGYCLAADVDSLQRIDGLIAAHRLDNTEYEYARLLEGIAAAGTYAQMRGVLMRMQADLNQLSPATAGYIAAFFEGSKAAQQAFAPAEQGGCPAFAVYAAAAADGAAGAAPSAEAAAEAAAPGAAEAAEAGAPGAAEAAAGGGWRWRVVQGAAVEAGGRCEAAGGSLRVIDLADEEWDAFATAIAQLARTNMGHRAHDFDAYVEWYGRNGPYDVLVDAANVAFFGQNHEGGGFNWNQIQTMYEMLRGRYPQKKILVMLHRKRLNDPEARTSAVQAFLEKLRRSKSFYYTPPGANDDWFWLYACVRAKHNGLLISNDELRDHIFSLLRPKHFLKWKARHIAHYAFSSQPAAGPGGGQTFELTLPRPYTSCLQQLPESAAWMVPVDDGTWLCVRPERVQ